MFFFASDIFNVLFGNISIFDFDNYLGYFSLIMNNSVFFLKGFKIIVAKFAAV